MKKLKKFISLLLLISILTTQTGINIFAQENSLTNSTYSDYIIIEGQKYSADDFAQYLSQFNAEECKIETEVESRILAGAVGVYFVPGVGEIALLTTGTVVLLGTAYHVGNKIYHAAVNWIHKSSSSSAKDRADNAADKIPNKLKVDDKHVDLDDFVDKYGNTPKDKNSGTFRSKTDKRYTIEKDTAGHTGYDGTTKKWKINYNDKRFGSLNEEGKVIGD